MGCQAAAIASLAKVVEQLLPDPAFIVTNAPDAPDWYIAKRGAAAVLHRMDES